MSIFNRFQCRYSQKGIYFYRIYRAYIMFLLPILVISISAYFYIRSATEHEIDQYNRNIINSTAASIENEFEEIEKASHLVAQSLANTELSDRTGKLTDGDIIKLSNLRKSLSNIHLIKNNIDDPYMYFAQKNMLLSADGSYSSEKFFEYFNRYERYNTAFWNTLATKSDYLLILQTTKVYQSSSLEKTNVENMIPVVVNYESYMNIDAILVMNINENYISTLMNQYRTSNENELFILNDEGEVISHSNTEMLYDLKYKNFINSTDEYIYGKKVDFDSSKYILYSKRIEGLKWTVFSIIPEREYYHKSNLILGVLAVINILLIIAGTASAYIFSGRLYSPIRNIVNVLLESKERNLQNKKVDEIEFIRENLDFLQKDRKDLNNEIGRMKPYVQERIIHNIIHTESSLHEEYFESIGKVEIIFHKKYFLVAIFNLVYSSRFIKEFSTNEYERMKEGIYNLIKSVILNKFNDCVFVESGIGQFYTVINYDDMQSSEQFFRLVESINCILKNDATYVRMYVMHANPVDKLSDIQKSYWKAHAALEYINLDDRNCIINAETLNEDSLLYFPLNVEDKLNNILLGKDEGATREFVEEIFHENFKEKRLIIKLKKLTQLLLDTCKKKAMYYNISQDLILRYGREYFSDNLDIDEVKEQFISLLKDMILQMEDHNTEKQELFEEYIESNYIYDMLSLEKMADDLNMNPNYLSRIFKGHVGQTFSDYLAGYRINKAKELLKNSNLSVEEIGTKVGISQRGTFTRIFKKYEGISPGVFRQIKK